MVHKKIATKWNITYKYIDRLYDQGKITDMEHAILYMAKRNPKMFRTFGVVKVNKGKDG